MDQLITPQTQKQIQEGNRKIKENEFFQDLTTLMENPTFIRFFKKHMSNWMEVKSSITNEIISRISRKYRELNNDELDKSIIIYLLCQIMKDNQLRPLSIKTVDEIYNNKKKLFNEFNKF